MILKSDHITSDITSIFEAVIQPVHDWSHKYSYKNYLSGNIKYVKPVAENVQIRDLTERIHHLESALADAQLENLVYRKYIEVSEKRSEHDG